MIEHEAKELEKTEEELAKKLKDLRPRFTFEQSHESSHSLNTQRIIAGYNNLIDDMLAGT